MNISQEMVCGSVFVPTTNREKVVQLLKQCGNAGYSIGEASQYVMRDNDGLGGKITVEGVLVTLFGTPQGVLDLLDIMDYQLIGLNPQMEAVETLEIGGSVPEKLPRSLAV